MSPRFSDGDHFFGSSTYLCESNDAISPSHFALEVYAFDDRPECESVAYAWGGKDDASTPWKPAFGRPYRDLLLARGIAQLSCAAFLATAEKALEPWGCMRFTSTKPTASQTRHRFRGWPISTRD